MHAAVNSNVTASGVKLCSTASNAHGAKLDTSGVGPSSGVVCRTTASRSSTRLGWTGRARQATTDNNVSTTGGCSAASSSGGTKRCSTEQSNEACRVVVAVCPKHDVSTRSSNLL